MMKEDLLYCICQWGFVLFEDNVVLPFVFEMIQALAVAVCGHHPRLRMTH